MKGAGPSLDIIGAMQHDHRRFEALERTMRFGTREERFGHHDPIARGLLSIDRSRMGRRIRIAVVLHVVRAPSKTDADFASRQIPRDREVPVPDRERASALYL